MIESAGGNYFVRLEEGVHYTPKVTGPETVTVRNLGDGPASFPQSAVVTDECLVMQADYDMTTGTMNLRIQASDRLNTPMLNYPTGLSVGFYPAGSPLTLMSAVPGAEPGSLQVTYQIPDPAIPAAPPQYVEVSSAQGWITGAEVLVIGNPLTIGPAMPIPPDQTRPLIRMQGENPATVAMGTFYNDAGATALDNNDGDLTASVQVSGLPIDTTAPAAFTVTYTATDAAGNTASAVRTVNVVTQTAPPAPTETCNLLTARYDSRRDNWVIFGTTDINAGQGVTVYLGTARDVVNSKQIGVTNAGPGGSACGRPLVRPVLKEPLVPKSNAFNLPPRSFIESPVRALTCQAIVLY